MMEKKFIETKKKEFAIKEFIRESLGKGKISDLKIERTPVGERIIIYTCKPGLIIGRRGEVIQEITSTLKRKFGLENPRLEIAEIERPEFDAQSVADQIALTLERFGPASFKIVAYKMLEMLKSAKALGAEIVLGGKLPSEKARSWRFAFGYMKKTGETDIVKSAKATAHTKPGSVGIKVSIVPKDAIIPDRIVEVKLIEEELPIKEEKIEEKAQEVKEEKIENKKERKTRKKKNGDTKKT